MEIQNSSVGILSPYGMKEGTIERVMGRRGMQEEEEAKGINKEALKTEKTKNNRHLCGVSQL